MVRGASVLVDAGFGSENRRGDPALVDRECVVAAGMFDHCRDSSVQILDSVGEAGEDDRLAPIRSAEAVFAWGVCLLGDVSEAGRSGVAP